VKKGMNTTGLVWWLLFIIFLPIIILLWIIF
jgi:hypothetical protein